MRRSTLVPFALLALATGAPAVAGDVVVTLTGVRADAGTLYVGLQTREQFHTGAGVAGTVLRDPGSGEVTVTLPDVPRGEYALGIWQDSDGDGSFSTAPDGRPTDGWSSLNAADLQAAPQFDEVAMIVGEAPVGVALAMIYPGAK